YLQCLEIVEAKGEISSLVNTYNNLAVIYNQLKQYDSARLLLNKALRIGKMHEPAIELTSIYNNLGNVCFRKKEFDEALIYFRRNYTKHLATKDDAALWVAVLNMADVFIEKKQFDSASHFADTAMKLAMQLGSRGKVADSYSILAKL